MSSTDREYDVFISHASEDKDTFVRPLAKALASFAIRVWFDEFSLRVGQSLSRSIDKGLAGARFGVVIISHAFMSKRWPEYELRGLIAREVNEGRVILPVWHGVSREQVLEFSPPLADKVALDTARLRAEDIAIQLLREIRPDIYSRHGRAELERIANGQAIRRLQEELDRTRSELESVREELGVYRCPYCEAALSESISAPADAEEKFWDTRDIFDCGYTRFGGETERPCPADPTFPAFEDFELRFSHQPDESHWKWSCFPVAKTSMAGRLPLDAAHGRTKDEALQNIRDAYARCARRR